MLKCYVAHNMFNGSVFHIFSKRIITQKMAKMVDDVKRFPDKEKEHGEYQCDEQQGLMIFIVFGCCTFFIIKIK